MDIRFTICTFALFFLLVSSIGAQSVFDITKYGGKPNGDITQV